MPLSVKPRLTLRRHSPEGTTGHLQQNRAGFFDVATTREVVRSAGYRRTAARNSAGWCKNVQKTVENVVSVSAVGPIET